MKTGRITRITPGNGCQFVDIQVRSENRVDQYTVKTTTAVKVGEQAIVPKDAKLTESFFV